MIWHPEWCVGDHRCNLAEHRAAEIVVDLPGYGRAFLTRVRAADGREHAEIRLRLALAPAEVAARRQLSGALADLRSLLTRAARLAYRNAA